MNLFPSQKIDCDESRGDQVFLFSLGRIGWSESRLDALARAAHLQPPGTIVHTLRYSGGDKNY